MKTQVIHIEPHDDYISVKDKMTWGQTARILLVWPPEGQVLIRHFDLVMLKRYSRELGAQLALVCKDHQVRAHARKLNILVYPNIRKAQQSHWRKPRRWGLLRRKPKKTRRQFKKGLKSRPMANIEALRLAAHPPTPKWLNHLGTRLVIFTIGVLAVLALAALFVPSAEIQLEPAIRQESIRVPITASPNYEQTSLTGQVPANWHYVIVEGRNSIFSSGSTRVPDKAARGEVIFTNLTDQPIQVPAGTVVATLDPEPIRFATTRLVTVPVGEAGNFVSVQALKPGRQGNLGSGEIIAIEGPLGLDLTVTNRAITSGGSEFTVAAPSNADYENLYDSLHAALEETAWLELQANLQPGDILLGIAPEYVQTLEETYFPESQTPSDELQLTLRLEFRAPVVRAGDLAAVGKAALETYLPVGYWPVEDTFVVENLGAPRLIEPYVGTWEIDAHWQVLSQPDRNRIISLSVGKKPTDAIQDLSDQFQLNDKPVISLTPEWWPVLPILPFRIQVSITEPNQLAAGSQQLTLFP